MLLFRLKRYICNGKNPKYINGIVNGIECGKVDCSSSAEIIKNNSRVCYIYFEGYRHIFVIKMSNWELVIEIFNNLVMNYKLEKYEKNGNIYSKTIYSLNILNNKYTKRIITETTKPNIKNELSMHAQRVLYEDFKNKFGMKFPNRYM